MQFLPKGLHVGLAGSSHPLPKAGESLAGASAEIDLQLFLWDESGCLRKLFSEIGCGTAKNTPSEAVKLSIMLPPCCPYLNLPAYPATDRNADNPPR